MGYRTMKARETALRLKRFAAEESVRKVAGLEQMIRELQVMASDLDRQIEAEEGRTGIKDPAHFSYSTFAKSATGRRDKIVVSINDLMIKLAAAEQERSDTASQLERANNPEPRDTSSLSRRRAEARTAAHR
jgi:flagellar protein FliJ